MSVLVWSPLGVNLSSSSHTRISLPKGFSILISDEHTSHFSVEVPPAIFSDKKKDDCLDGRGMSTNSQKLRLSSHPWEYRGRIETPTAGD